MGQKAIAYRFADIDRRPEQVDLIRRQFAPILRPHHRRTTPSARDESLVAWRTLVAYINGGSSSERLSQWSGMMAAKGRGAAAAQALVARAAA
jgi:hypothetical protein